MTQAKLIESLEQFLEVLEKSKLFSPERIQKLRQDLKGSNKQPLDIARMLVKNRKLSKWQAGQLLSGYFKFRQGQFVLRDQLGKSRLGGLFLAHDEKRSQLVAIRSLSKAAAANAGNVERFVLAAESAIKLKHENVARVLELNSEGERHLIVTEYVSGRDLKKQIEEEGPLSATQAVTYLQQAADALTLAHKQQVIHGSLQPACLLVDASGVVKIADWGLAPLRAAKRGYCSPEQLDGKPADAGADLFSLGSTLYFLLTGRAPFEASSPEEEKAIADSKRPIPLNKLCKDVPRPLVDLCNQMMACDPTQRLGLMQDVVSRLTEFAAAGDDADLIELEADVLLELEDDTKSDEPTAGEATDEAAGAKDEQASDDTVVNVAIGDAHKTSTISDTTAIAISTGKESTAGPVGAFKISTKKKKKKKTKSQGAAKEEPAAAPAETDEFVTAAKPGTGSLGTAAKQNAAKSKDKPVTKSTKGSGTSEPAKDGSSAKKRSGIPLGVIIGLAALFGLTLLGGGALLIALFLFRGGEDVVAQAAAAADAAAESETDPEASDPDVDPEDVPDEIELVQDDPQRANSADAAIDQADTTAGTTTADADPPDDPPADAVATPTASTPSSTPGAKNSSTPETANSSTPGTENAATGDVQSEPASDEPQVKPAAETDTKKPAADADGKKKKAEAEAAAKKKVDQAAAAKKKAAEKKKAEEKKKKAIPVFVFKPTVELPAIPTADAAGTPSVLGKINISPTDVCFISMTGGDTAARGRAEFSIRNAKSGTAPRDWELVVRDDSIDTVIATLALPEKELSFHWQPAAAESQFAGNLRNCSLKMTAGSAKPQLLALRSPIVGESVPIDLTKPSIQARWNVDSPPDPSTLQIATSLKGHKMVLDPPQPIGAMKGTQWIYLGENKDTALLALKLDTTVTARGIQVTLKPFMKFAGEKPLAYNKGTKKRVTQSMSKQGQIEQAKIAFLQNQLKKAPREKKQQVQIALTQAEQGFQAFGKMAQQVSQLDQIEQSYAGALLDFEVIYRTIQGETVLVRTQAGGGTP
ncbi:MAG: serine/threonine-protein kinase [Pirellulaceae bacterium]|nr:serine/threonine-protein kinase [Pirellulaceae bacterium]